MDDLEKALRYIMEADTPDADKLRKDISAVCQLPYGVLFPKRKVSSLKEKAAKGLGICRFHLEKGSGFCDECPYFGEEDCRYNMVEDVYKLLLAQDDVISELCRVGYPHGFDGQEPWIIDYLNSITEVIKKAVRLKNG